MVQVHIGTATRDVLEILKDVGDRLDNPVQKDKLGG